jgi:hypothetical protein
MKNKKFGVRGMIWCLSKITIPLGAVMLFTLLWIFHTNLIEVNAMDSAIQESRNMARVIDEVGSSPSACEIKYETPGRLSGRLYEIKIVTGEVIISLSDHGMNYSALFTSKLRDNISAVGGSVLGIRKDNGVIEIL